MRSVKRSPSRLRSWNNLRAKQLLIVLDNCEQVAAPGRKLDPAMDHAA
ncbi:MAG: hypothetical protein ACRDRP_10645 [Pseudonocardiaceae bacterium]